MLYAVDLYAISNNADMLTALKTKVPTKLDNKTWPTHYEVRDVYDDIQEAPAVRIEVRFINKADRTAALNSINALAEFKPDVLLGSFVGKHLCGHDEGLPCSSIVKLWEKS
jgi:hypothetical protein